MDIVTIRTFLAAASAGSFSEASQRIHASPSAVTERIKQLEHVLRVRLFERDKRGCRLTAAGRRFLDPALKMQRAWQQGCEQTALPPRFTQLVRVGGQHALWPRLLMPWLDAMRGARRDIAFHAVAAAPAQLNRALDDAELDIAFLYEPRLARGQRIEQLADDRLILVTANPSVDWTENFVRTEWGEAVKDELRARLGDLPSPGLTLDLGVLSLDWLARTGSSGFVPERLAESHISSGQLEPVEDMPALAFSPYVCWSAAMEDSLVENMIAIARGMMEGPAL